MKRDYLKTLHRDRGITAMLSTVEDYERLKKEEIDWKPHIKSQITRIEIPFELFMRLMALDKDVDKAYNMMNNPPDPKLKDLAVKYLEESKEAEVNDLQNV